MSKRIYIVTPIRTILPDAKQRLVRASTASQAVHFATRGLYQVAVATTEDVAKLVGTSVKVEDVQQEEE